MLEPVEPSGANDLLYVGNTGNNSITVYRHDASGNTPPLYVIAGSNTGISSPGPLSEDAYGNLYVANGGSTTPGLLVFAHGANGNVAPIRKLAGPLTGIHQITAMTVDKKTGKIFIGDFIPGTDPSLSPILRFPRNANGNQAPSAKSAAVGLSHGFASDSTGNNLIVAAVLGGEGHDQQLNTLAKEFVNGAQPAQLYSIQSVFAYSIADDPATKTYVVSGSYGGTPDDRGIIRFAENTVGYGEDAGHGASFKPPLKSTITRDPCPVQLAVAPGPTPYTYVSNAAQSGCPADAVYVYTNAASGKATPLRILSGSATMMNQPYGIYEGK